MTFIQILYFASFITPILAPFLYKCKRPKMLLFYLNMAMRPSFRKIYSLMMVLYLIAFHFYHLTIYNNPTCLVPSTLLVLYMYSHYRSEKVFHLLQDQRTMLFATVGGILCMLVPSFLPLGFTIVTIAVCALFYPSKLLRNNFNSIGEKEEFWKNALSEVVDIYFRWDLMEGSEVNNQHRSKRGRWWSCGKRKKFSPDPNAIEDAEVVEYLD